MEKPPALIITLTLALLLCAGCDRAPARPPQESTPVQPTVAPSSSPTPAATELPAGKARVWEKDGATLVYVPAGEFQMGSDRYQVETARKLCKAYSKDLGTAVCGVEKFQDERPEHMVTLDGFWIDRTEVTNGQYRRCVAAGACRPPVESGSFTRDA
jgi:formylglycine-generating enzyme required for sulfatase activity